MIYSKIKKMCKANGINIDRLEKACGLSNGTISYWRKGSPRVENLQKVADYFGVSIEFLLKE